MKKLLKSSLLLMVMAIFMFALTGCGGNKLVATKSEDDSFMGQYEMKVEVKFKKNVADKVTTTYTFKDKDKADAMAALLKLGEDSSKFEQKGKKIVYKQDVADYAKDSGLDKDKLTKEYLKDLFEKEGFKVK